MQPLPQNELLSPDYQGWNYDYPIFNDFVKDLKPKTIIEVGTWKGMSASKIYKAAQTYCDDFKLICVDTWQGGIEHMEGMEHGSLMNRSHGYPMLYFQFLSNMQHMGCIDKLETIPNTSANAARWLKHKNIKAELIYIDGSHESPDVLQDAENYYPILLDGGLMFGDDYNYAPVQNDINNFASKNKLEIIKLYNNNFWVVRKN